MDCQKNLTSILIGCYQQREDLNVFSNGWAELLHFQIISAYIVPAQNTSDTNSNNRIYYVPSSVSGQDELKLAL